MNGDGPRFSADKLRLLRKRAGPARIRISRRADRTSPAPVSAQQRALWFLDELSGAGQNTTYNVNSVIRLRGNLVVPALEWALSEIVRRHEVLRTTLAESNGEPVQLVRPVEPVVLAVHDAEDEHAEARLLAAEAAKPFDLAAAALFRAALVRLGPEEHTLFLGFHHAVFDGSSVNVLCRELSTCYRAFVDGTPAELSELDIQYSDFAVWQHDRLASGVLERELEYWRRQLSGAPALSTVPADRPRPPAATFAGAELRSRVPLELIEQLELLARSERMSLFMVLLSAFQVLLHRYSGRTDLCVGTPVAGRTPVELEPLIGYFVNTLVLRGDLSGDPSFREYLGRTRDVALSAFEHQEVPFDRLVETLRPNRTLSHSPLFQTMFVLQEAGRVAFDLPGLAARLDDVPGTTAKFDLTLVMWPEPDGFVTAFEYATDLYDHGTIKGLAEDFRSVLESVLADPDLGIGEFGVRHATRPASAGDHQVPAPAVEYVAPRTPTERFLAELWAELLGLDRVGVRDDLFALGGHSFTVMHALGRIRRELGTPITASAVFFSPTVESLGRQIDDTGGHSPLVPLMAGGAHPPLFLVHPVGGSVGCYGDLARALGADQPTYGLIARGLDGNDEPLKDIETMAADYRVALKAAGHHPPFVLGGWSMGGVVAYEMARQFESRSGEPVPVVLIDSYPPDQPLGDDPGEVALLAWFAQDWGDTMGVELAVTERDLAALPEPRRLPHLLARARAVSAAGADAEVSDLQGMVRVFLANARALRTYRPEPGHFSGPVALLAAKDNDASGAAGPDHGWGRWTTGEVDVRPVPGDHYSVLRDPSLPRVITEIRRGWAAFDGSTATSRIAPVYLS